MVMISAASDQYLQHQARFHCAEAPTGDDPLADEINLGALKAVGVFKHGAIDDTRCQDNRHRACQFAYPLRQHFGDMTGAQTMAHQTFMMGEIAKLLGDDGALDTAAADNTVGVLMSGGSDPVITKEPEGAWTSVVTDKAAEMD